MKPIGLLIILLTPFSFISAQESTKPNYKTMTNSIKVAAAQLSPVFLNKQKTVEKA